MSSKGVPGIQCLAYRCGCLCEHVEQREIVLSVWVTTEQDSHFIKKIQNMEDFVALFPYTLTEFLVSVNALVRTTQQLTTGQAQLFSACFAFLVLAACKVANSV